MIRTAIPSQLEEVPAVVDAVVEAVEAAGGYQDRSVFAIRLAIDEAVTNAIRHGNGQDPDKQVTIEYEITGELVRVCVCDEGPGFVPETLPDPTAEENLIRTHGRGVMLMNAYMTEVSFNERGNCVTLVKRRDCPKPTED
ncbi:MAG: ATP-binding protein [Planctomycetota bacterium]